MKYPCFDNIEVSDDWAFENVRSTEQWTHGYHRYPAKFLPNVVKKLIENWSAEGYWVQAKVMRMAVYTEHKKDAITLLDKIINDERNPSEKLFEIVLANFISQQWPNPYTMDEYWKYGLEGQGDLLRNMMSSLRKNEEKPKRRGWIGTTTYFGNNHGDYVKSLRILQFIFDTGIYLETKRIITELAYHEFELVDGVEDVLKALSGKYRLAIATKGDLIEQLTKFRESGLDGYFHHIEVLPAKSEDDYRRMARKLDILPEEILMVGNAVKSDIAPVVAVGGTAIHVPYTVTWHHEMMEMPESDRIYEIKSIKNLPELLL